VNIKQTEQKQDDEQNECNYVEHGDLRTLVAATLFGAPTDASEPVLREIAGWLELL
jgi:hypothetical protein